VVTEKSTETAFLDPIEFSPGRVEVGLDELGLRIMSADWGESDVELFLIRQAHGEVPADAHPPNRTMVIKLKAEEDHSMPLSEVVQRLESKIALIQEEEGWVKRKADIRGRYAAQVAYPVRKIALAGIQGWMMAHRQIADEITMTLTTGPYCYRTTPIELGPFEEEGRELIFKMAKILGTAPGLIRHSIKNENEDNDWDSAIVAMESRDYREGTTAELTYEAEDLTLLGHAKKATKAGASGGEALNVVKSGSLSQTWAALISSKIAASGKHMNHKGNRRMFVRLWDPNDQYGNIRLKLEYRSLGSVAWSSNKGKATLVSGGFSYIDFGECRIEEAALGEDRWEFRLLAMTTGPGGEEIEIDKFYPFPTEQFEIVQKPEELSTGGTVLWEDYFNQEAGNLTGKIAPVGGTYEGEGDADDFVVDPTTGEAKRTAKGDSSLNNGRFLVASGTKKAYQKLEGEITGLNFISNAQKSGYLFRYKDKSNWGMLSFIKGVIVMPGPIILEACKLRVEKCVAGVVTVLKESELVQQLAAGGGLFLTVTAGGSITAEAKAGHETGTLYAKLVLEDADFKTGGSLAEGKVGMYDAMTATGGSSTNPRKFRKPLATVAPGESGFTEEDSVCFAGRGIEYRSEGCFRQHSTDEVWGRLIPDGFAPYAPPSRLEGRAARCIIVPSQGDFESKPDSGTNKIKDTVIYFPGYHFLSEAA
jgi:hypothetical protein